MKYLKPFIFILFGFFLGIGSGFFLFTDENQKSNPLTEKLFQSSRKKTNKDKEDDKTTDKISSKKEVSTSDENQKPTIDTIPILDSDSGLYDSDSKIDKVDSVFIANSNPEDSVLIDENIDLEMDESDDESALVVQKEELIKLVEIKAVLLDTVSAKVKTDTSIEKMAEVKPKTENLLYKVEFWDSPINFSGYKMANNRLVIFGLDYIEGQPKLYLVNKKVYLKHLNQYFALETSYDFKPLKKVKDPNLLNFFELKLK